MSLLAPGAHASEDFVVGSGQARASIFEVVPRTGGLTIPISFGRASASYQGVRAQATSLAARFPVDSPAAAPADCGDRAPGGGGEGGGGGGPAPAPPSPTENPFASTITVSSDDEGSEEGRRASSFASPPESPVAGAATRQEVVATDDPAARATTVEGDMSVLEVAEYTTARADARSGVIDGKARESTATVTMDRLALLEGLVVFEQVRWRAVHRSGDDTKADGAFSFGSVSVGGTPLPPPPEGPDGADPLAAVNTALAPTGLALKAPVVERAGEAVRVTPLTLRLSDSPLGQTTLGPALGELQPVRDPLVEALLSFSCDFGPAVLVADVLASIASGSGGISLDFGGVSATTEGQRFDNPFDSPIDGAFEAPPAELPQSPPPTPAPALDVAAPPPPLPNPSVGALTPSYGAAPVPDPPAPSFSDEVASPQSEFARPAVGPSSRQVPGHRGGAALAVGAVGLAAILAVAAADALRLRRAARTIS